MYARYCIQTGYFSIRRVQVTIFPYLLMAFAAALTGVLTALLVLFITAFSLYKMVRDRLEGTQVGAMIKTFTRGTPL